MSTVITHVRVEGLRRLVGVGHEGQALQRSPRNNEPHRKAPRHLRRRPAYGGRLLRIRRHRPLHHLAGRCRLPGWESVPGSSEEEKEEEAWIESGRPTLIEIARLQFQWGKGSKGHFSKGKGFGRSGWTVKVGKNGCSNEKGMGSGKGRFNGECQLCGTRGHPASRRPQKDDWSKGVRRHTAWCV